MTTPFHELPTTAYCDVIGRDRVLDFGLRALTTTSVLAGPAYPVACPAGDNLMLHVAIHRAPPGSVIVCAAGDTRFAMAGGNVCAWAQRRGVLGLVVDGLVRDVAESRAIGFPIFARGTIPIPAPRALKGLLNVPIVCAGVVVAPGDVIVADEEGVIALPSARAEVIYRDVKAKADADAALGLEKWVERHKAKVDELCVKLGIEVD